MGPGAMPQKPLYAIGYGADWPSQRPCFRPHPEFRRRGCRPQATERARRMAARSCRQVQSRRAANPRPPSARFTTASSCSRRFPIDQRFSAPVHRPRQARGEGCGFRDRRYRTRVHGAWEPIGFEDMPKLDFCVVGCVAVTRSGRTGKGAGFADLEQGVIRELGLVSSSMPITRTVQPPRSWPIPRWSWKAITRLWIISRRNSS